MKTHALHGRLEQVETKHEEHEQTRFGEEETRLTWKAGETWDLTWGAQANGEKLPNRYFLYHKRQNKSTSFKLHTKNHSVKTSTQPPQTTVKIQLKESKELLSTSKKNLRNKKTRRKPKKRVDTYPCYHCQGQQQNLQREKREFVKTSPLKANYVCLTTTAASSKLQKRTLTTRSHYKKTHK